MTPRVVRATTDHLNEVAVLFDTYRQWYGQKPNLDGAKKFLTARLEQGDSAIFLSLDKSTALGFTQLYPSFSSISMRPIWILNDLFVLEYARRMGVACSLMKEAERFARETNSARLVLATANDNRAAQALYEKLGWIKDHEFMHYKYNL
jgi:ribosomal protein S18 acetylase RimI-like enzyme